MAIKTRDSPASAPRTLYEGDLYTWVQEQVALLRAGRLDEVDALNVAEELGDVGKSEYYRLQSAITVLSMHLLKWDHQPKRRSRSWMSFVSEQRSRIDEVLKENPGLKSRLQGALETGYKYGRDRAVGETGLDYEQFPEACPYTFEEMMTRPIVFERSKKRKQS